MTICGFFRRQSRRRASFGAWDKPLECDDYKARFDAKLGKLAKAKQVTKR
jgi:hypothetical protein